MSKREAKLLIDDIVESAHKILNYTEGQRFEDFVNDSKTIDAVVRNFEIIGEAANRLPAEFKNNHPLIDWQRIIGLRNRIVHEYFGIVLFDCMADQGKFSFGFNKSFETNRSITLLFNITAKCKTHFTATNSFSLFKTE